MKETLQIRIKQNVKVYESLDDFVSDVSSKFSPNVSLDNIINLVVYFGIFLALVLVVCVLDFLDLIKQLQTINRTLVYCSTRLLQEMLFRWLPLLKITASNSESTNARENAI